MLFGVTAEIRRYFELGSITAESAQPGFGVRAGPDVGAALVAGRACSHNSHATSAEPR